MIELLTAARPTKGKEALDHEDGEGESWRFSCYDNATFYVVVYNIIFFSFY